MATAGHNVAPTDSTPTTEPAQGAEYGFPKDQIKGQGGRAEVEVNADLADRFEAAKRHAQESGGISGGPLDEKHKSGMEPVTERPRDLTAVTEAKVKSGGTAETRTPDIGFPAAKDQ